MGFLLKVTQLLLTTLLQDSVVKLLWIQTELSVFLCPEKVSMSQKAFSLHSPHMSSSAWEPTMILMHNVNVPSISPSILPGDPGYDLGPKCQVSFPRAVRWPACDLPASSQTGAGHLTAPSWFLFRLPVAAHLSLATRQDGTSPGASTSPQDGRPHQGNDPGP